MMFVCVMVFNVTFNNISVISWWSVLLVEETGGPGENHRPVFCYTGDTMNNISHISLKGGRCGRDRMVVEFTTTYAISVYHH
jgi:hypothetical protein